METKSFHSNQSSYPIGIKTQLFVPPYLQMLYIEYGKNLPDGFIEDVV